LILPNAAALSDRQLDEIRAYVSNGGGLVASCETSICDELIKLLSALGLVNNIARFRNGLVRGC
jgi:hypothetical protein